MEARGESTLGRYAIATVISTRAIERNLSPLQVCLQPRQFSCWNTGGQYTNYISPRPQEPGSTMKFEPLSKVSNRYYKPPSGVIWEECIKLGRLITTGKFVSSLDKINHYNRNEIVRSGWKKYEKYTIENHVFYYIPVKERR